MSSLADTAALFADRTRAAFCEALLDGRAWTSGELARHVGVSASTASEQLSRLVSGGLLAEERQGRHRYVRLAGPEAAALTEALAAYAPGTSRPRTLRASVRQDAEARARTCYDHLAGRLGVALADAMTARGLVDTGSGIAVTPAGRTWLTDTLDYRQPAGARRPLVRTCLDWTERRSHLAGALGAALCTAALDRGWVRRVGSGRAVKVTPEGSRAFGELLGVEA
ncbi:MULTISPECIES: winged helix-turn-helix domain-containing protein [unclassified Streptomyces]|uniref:ArsR/SmtB family transcription factor n=1 Tax=unclassified Streptomyces TaxID=2593676 RepID=UPI002E7FE98E|nr:winged helix-turn-helix domain-containing protein [Streptomyces sp. NBC_00523]WUD03235.1 winged helix-turn-helix domain-containing protein [Streptomyces sp. NBC_00523]